MHEYDIALKLMLQASPGTILQQVTGVQLVRWLNVEMPQVQTSRVDLLGETADAKLVHLELQSTNDPTMAVRMAEYALRIYRQFGRFPKQIVLYVGEVPLHMPASLHDAGASTPALSFRYTLMDIRDLDTATLLASAHIEDNLLAILTRLQDQADIVRQTLARIANLDEPGRRAAFAQFLIISGLRRLAPVVKEEAQKMPILNDILDHEVIGPAILQGRREGLEEGRITGHREGRLAGRQEGRLEGLQEGYKQAQYKTLRRGLERRFGAIPPWVEHRLADLSAVELDELAVRVFDASHLEDLFPAS